MKNKIKYIIFLLIGLASIFWIYNFFNGPESMLYIYNHKEKLIFILLAHIPTLYLDSLSWQLIMKNKISILWCVIITWISQTAGKVLPTGIASGEFVRAYLAIKKGLKPAEASSTVLGDLILATISLAFVAMMGVIFLVINSKDFQAFGEYSKYFSLSIITLSLFVIIFSYLIRKRAIKYLVRKTDKLFKYKVGNNLIKNLIKFDFELFKLSFKLNLLFWALLTRLLGWLGGAFEIFVFFIIIGIDIRIIDVIIIEAFTGIVRAVAFFIPAGIGVQEIAFIVVGNYVGLSTPLSFAAAIGRRIREILVGIPALITWYLIFNKKLKIN